MNLMIRRFRQIAKPHIRISEINEEAKVNQTPENFLENKRIFLIEDDVINLGVLTRTLARSGANVCVNYSSIGIVVHVTQNLPIDLILLDINLRRGISGYDVIEQLRANPDIASIPVVAVTSLDPEIE